MANSESKRKSFPLNKKEIHPRVNPTRVHIVLYTCAILALLYHHHLHLNRPMSRPTFSLFLALFLSDLILAFMWVTSQGFRYRPIRRIAYPENLSRAVHDDDLPRLDVFICTADPYKEPPLCTVNTALSVLAFDYPTNKISAYVSDDGGSQMTLFALMEASRFAKHWLPYCKEHRITKRSPAAFFNGGDRKPYGDDRDKIKILYERMKERIERVMEQGHVDDNMITSEEERKIFYKWTDGFSRQDHPTIIQVLLETDRDVDSSGQCMPNLIYLSREKSKIFHHNFKAGALNVLIRVSAMMTNAPIVLSLDCDMYSNDPQAPCLALCHLLDPVEGPQLAFVQFPQCYKGINRSDIYNNELRRPFKINATGLDGLGVTNYVGTGSFIRRKALYGGPSQKEVRGLPGFNNGDAIDQISISSRSTLDAAHRVAACSFEQGTNWGLTMGFRYGTLVEDFFTGYRLQCEGWCSALCDPPTPVFVGDFPITLNDTLMQFKRWLVGFLEVAFSKYCPLTFGTTRRSLLMGFCYGFYSLWSLWSIPILTYGILPQLGLLYNIYLFPKVSSRWIYLHAYLFLASYTLDLIENLLYGITFWKWWCDQRMWMIRGVSAYLFSLVEFSLKLIGLSALDFNVTSKVIDNEQQKRYDQEMFDFGVETPLFVPLSTVALINLVSFTWGVMKVMKYGNMDEMFVQLFISGFVVVNAWPIYEAMILRRDGGRMPTRITLFSILLAWLICNVAAFALK